VAEFVMRAGGQQKTGVFNTLGLPGRMGMCELLEEIRAISRT
jgi:hypothetical protein